MKADAMGCPVIIANDPDADRLAVAEKLPRCACFVSLLCSDLYMFLICLTNNSIYVVSCFCPVGQLPVLCGKAWTLDIMCQSFNQILSYLLCL